MPPIQRPTQPQIIAVVLDPNIHHYLSISWQPLERIRLRAKRSPNCVELCIQ